MNPLKQSLLETLGVADPWDSDYEHMKFDSIRDLGRSSLCSN